MSVATDTRDLKQCVLDAQERRLRSRKSIHLRAQIMLMDESLLEGHTVDLSLAGLGLFSPVRIPVGEECAVTFELAACGETRAIRLQALVCYCTPHSANCYRIGMRVINADPATTQLIDILLS
jgi:hypothetical protein